MRQLKCSCCGFISGEHIDFIKNIIFQKVIQWNHLVELSWLGVYLFIQNNNNAMLKQQLLTNDLQKNLDIFAPIFKQTGINIVFLNVWYISKLKSFCNN